MQTNDVSDDAARTFGKVLRHWRKASGRTQADIEAEVGLAAGTMSRLESGTTKRGPDKATSTLLAEAIGTTCSPEKVPCRLRCSAWSARTTDNPAPSRCSVLASRSAASRTPSSSFTKDGAGVAGVDATRFCPGNCSSPETNVRQTISICRMLPGASADQPPGTDKVSHLRNHGENADTQPALASAVGR